MMAQALVDKGIGKFISRTLLVFLLFVGLFIAGKIPEEHFFEITMVYIGGRKVLDGLSMFLNKKKDEEK